MMMKENIQLLPSATVIFSSTTGHFPINYYIPSIHDHTYRHQMLRTLQVILKAVSDATLPSMPYTITLPYVMMIPMMISMFRYGLVALTTL